MSAITCPGCGTQAEQLDDGRIICDDGDTRFELDADDIATITTARRMVDDIKAGVPAADVVHNWRTYQTGKVS